MKKMMKVISVILVFAMLCSSLAFAAEIDFDAFSRVLMRGGINRFIAPLISSFGESIPIYEARAEKEAVELVDRGHFAYVVSAFQRLNMETGKYYAELVLINETGKFEAVTIEDVENYNFLPVFTTERIGQMSELVGRFIQFDMRKTDKIQKLEPRRGQVQTDFSTADGFYLVNIIDERNGILSFYDTADDVTVSEPAHTCRFHEDGCALISIDGDNYAGEFLTRAGKRQQEFFAGFGNAVIQISEGEVVRVFSFEGGYEA